MFVLDSPTPQTEAVMLARRPGFTGQGRWITQNGRPVFIPGATQPGLFGGPPSAPRSAVPINPPPASAHATAAASRWQRDREGPRAEPPATPASRGAVDIADTRAVADAARDAARRIPDAFGGQYGTQGPAATHKANISEVYDAMRADGTLGPDVTLDQFKAALVDAFRDGRATIARLDLKRLAAKPGETERSVLAHMGKEYHLLSIPVTSPAPASPAAAPTAQPLRFVDDPRLSPPPAPESHLVRNARVDAARRDAAAARAASRMGERRPDPADAPGAVVPQAQRAVERAAPAAPQHTADDAIALRESIRANPNADAWERSGSDRLLKLAEMVRSPRAPDLGIVDEIAEQYGTAGDPARASHPLGQMVDSLAGQLRARGATAPDAPPASPRVAAAKEQIERTLGPVLGAGPFKKVLADERARTQAAAPASLRSGRTGDGPGTAAALKPGASTTIDGRPVTVTHVEDRTVDQAVYADPAQAMTTEPIGVRPVRHVTVKAWDMEAGRARTFTFEAPAGPQRITERGIPAASRVEPDASAPRTAAKPAPRDWNHRAMTARTAEILRENPKLKYREAWQRAMAEASGARLSRAA